MLVHIKEIIKKAQVGKYAVGAFNTFNLETTLAIVRAAEKKDSPVIIQITESTIKYAGLKNIFSIIKTISNNSKVPVAVHLDHGKSLKIIKKCIKLGFSSVHFDGSELSYKNNLKLTLKTAKYANKRGVWVQGELGNILGKKDINQKNLKDIEKYLTDPEEAQEFVKQTKINTFAPSVGTLHGMYKGKEKINQELLKKISGKIKLPIVLHGASGVSDNDIQQAIKNGVRIINIDTRLRKEFTQTLKQTLKGSKEIDPRKILTPEIKAIQKAVEEKITLFNL